MQDLMQGLLPEPASSRSFLTAAFSLVSALLLLPPRCSQKATDSPPLGLAKLLHKYLIGQFPGLMWPLCDPAHRTIS